MQSLENLKSWMQINKPLTISRLMNERRKIEKGFSIIEKYPEEVIK
jgi:hypothetical protein